MPLATLCLRLCSFARARADKNMQPTVPLQPGQFKLGEWLADPDVVAILTSGTVRSLTYKANQFGPTITKDEATANSASWYEIGPEEANLGAALDALPTAQWDEEASSEPASTPGSSAPGSSASHTATPPGRGCGAGRGRGRGH